MNILAVVALVAILGGTVGAVVDNNEQETTQVEQGN